MYKKDIDQFVKDLRVTFLRDFMIPAQPKPSLLYSNKSNQLSVDKSDIPVPELVQFLLGFILKLPIYGPEEKLRWEIPFNYKEISCAFALQKFGLRLHIASAEGQQLDVNKVSMEIIKKIQKAIHRVEKTLLMPFAEQQIRTGHVTIANQYYAFMNRYIYFREKAEKAINQEKSTNTKNIEELTQSLNEIFRAKNELFYNTIAMLDAYFSFLEHLFVLVMPLYLNNVRLLEFIGSFWADKYKMLFDIRSNPSAKSFYDDLNTIKERFRNFYAHGGFEKGGASLYIHIPNIGAIPAQFSKVKNSPHFDIIPIREDSFSDICKIIDGFDKWLRSEDSGLQLAIRYAESGLDLPCDKQTIQKIRSAMTSDESLEGLIEYYSHIWEMHTNMDY